MSGAFIKKYTFGPTVFGPATNPSWVILREVDRGMIETFYYPDLQGAYPRYALDATDTIINIYQFF